ncbi:TetR/AcrR family transcriptional regulator [Pseudochryseolinea flava]|uniref:TetR/AcrR family transcriptional regulator n=1 Tax=Pseudochryseolinea flava TaxID=2059302 RepID=A0A364XVK4_9BACT|nr:TetR/AcrR family transcriptional regulator [Pseudochryseolinea flava]RAV98159.1 TetR/AcrR family transcriptional regulator [Pseudochryseolinea flava]
MAIVSFQLNAKLYVRDPQSTQLGQNIIQTSIKMIEKRGFDEFTFKKLGLEIGSPEASIYRYFESKHRLLLYLIDWYWTWLEYRIDFSNNNIKDPITRLSNAIRLLVEPKAFDPNISFVDEARLHRIVNSEFEKTYLTRNVDADNKEGLFLPYNALCNKIASIIKEVNPKYPYPRALISTILLSANHQLYYSDHLPSLTEIKSDSKKKHTDLASFLESLVFNTVNVKIK